jgi:hypothetical protein
MKIAQWNLTKGIKKNTNLGGWGEPRKVLENQTFNSYLEKGPLMGKQANNNMMSMDLGVQSLVQ